MRIGLTHHAIQRIRERMPALSEVTEGRIRADIERMVQTAMPYHMPDKGDRGQLWRTIHEASGQDVVLAIVDQKGCDVRLVVTVMTLEQAKHWKRKPKASMRRVKHKTKRLDSRTRQLIRSGYRDASNDMEAA